MCDCNKSHSSSSSSGPSLVKNAAEDTLLPQQKLVVLGTSGVGKTNIVKRLMNEEFTVDTETTIGAAYSIRAYRLKNGTVISFSIWDTAGQERFNALTPLYYRGANVLLLVFDITDKSSFQRAIAYYDEVKPTCPTSEFYLIGNKCDLPNRSVTVKEAETYAKEHHLVYMETSAKTAHNCAELFIMICENTYSKISKSK